MLNELREINTLKKCMKATILQNFTPAFVLQYKGSQKIRYVQIYLVNKS